MQVKVGVNILVEQKQNNYKESYSLYAFRMNANGDRFYEQWRPFTYQEWIENGMPKDDGGVNLDDGKAYSHCFDKYNLNG